MSVRRLPARTLGALAAVLAFAAAGCGSDSDTSTTAGDTATTVDSATSAPQQGSNTTAGATTSPGGDGEPVRGGSMTMSIFKDPGTLHPIRSSTTTGRDGLSGLLVYEPLLRLNAETGEVTPQLAEGLTPDDDLRVWTLKLREGVVFSDGEPFDADAVKYNWDLQKDPANGSPAAGALAGVESVEVIDPLTLEITLTDPSSSFMQTVASRLWVIGSPKAIEERGEDIATNPVGAGPFVLKEWIPNDHLTFERNPNYWQADAGLPYLDEIIQRPLTDVEQALNTMRQGDIEVIVTQDVQVGAAMEEEFNRVGQVSSAGSIIAFNLTAEPFDDPRAREAFIHSIDLESINEVALEGNGLPQSEGPFVKDSPYYDPDTTWLTFDPDRAQELWDELAAENGGPTKFTLTGFANIGAEIEAMGAQLDQYDNVEVTIDFPDASALQKAVLAHEYELSQWGARFSGTPDPTIANLFLSGLSTNPTGYANPAFDEAVERARATVDAEEQAAAWRDAFAELAKDNPVFWTFHTLESIGHVDAIHGIEMYDTGYFAIEKFWKSE